MNKKGITVVELVVTFSLTITVAIFLIQIILTVSKIYTKNGIKTEMLNKKSIISNEINTKFRNSSIDSIEACGEDCYVFKYTDTTSSILKIENGLLTFGDFATKFSSSGINLDLIYGPTVQNYVNDSIFKLTISGDYPINIIYQFDKDTSRIDEFFTE